MTPDLPWFRLWFVWLHNGAKMIHSVETILWILSFLGVMVMILSRDAGQWRQVTAPSWPHGWSPGSTMCCPVMPWCWVGEVGSRHFQLTTVYLVMGLGLNPIRSQRTAITSLLAEPPQGALHSEHSSRSAVAGRDTAQQSPVTSSLSESHPRGRPRPPKQRSVCLIRSSGY